MVYFDYSSKHELLAFSIKIFKKINLKINSLEILNLSLLQAKTLLIPLEKEIMVKMIQFYLLQQNITVDPYLNV